MWMAQFQVLLQDGEPFVTRRFSTVNGLLCKHKISTLNLPSTPNVCTAGTCVRRLILSVNGQQVAALDQFGTHYILDQYLKDQTSTLVGENTCALYLDGYPGLLPSPFRHHYC